MLADSIQDEDEMPSMGDLLRRRDLFQNLDLRVAVRARTGNNIPYLPILEARRSRFGIAYDAPRFATDSIASTTLE